MHASPAESISEQLFIYIMDSAAMESKAETEDLKQNKREKEKKRRKKWGAESEGKEKESFGNWNRTVRIISIGLVGNKFVTFKQFWFSLHYTY